VQHTVTEQRVRYEIRRSSADAEVRHRAYGRRRELNTRVGRSATGISGALYGRCQSTDSIASMSVFRRIDHAAGAHEVGLELSAAELLIFGNARSGTRLLQLGPTSAIDLH
jgi:hypothetical protein